MKYYPKPKPVKRPKMASVKEIRGITKRESHAAKTFKGDCLTCPEHPCANAVYFRCRGK